MRRSEAATRMARGSSGERTVAPVADFVAAIAAIVAVAAPRRPAPSADSLRDGAGEPVRSGNNQGERQEDLTIAGAAQTRRTSSRRAHRSEILNGVRRRLIVEAAVAKAAIRMRVEELTESLGFVGCHWQLSRDRSSLLPTAAAAVSQSVGLPAEKISRPIATMN